MLALHRATKFVTAKVRKLEEAGEDEQRVSATAMGPALLRVLKTGSSVHLYSRYERSVWGYLHLVSRCPEDTIRKARSPLPL